MPLRDFMEVYEWDSFLAWCRGLLEAAGSSSTEVNGVDRFIQLMSIKRMNVFPQIWTYSFNSHNVSKICREISISDLVAVFLPNKSRPILPTKYMPCCFSRRTTYSFALSSCVNKCSFLLNPLWIYDLPVTLCLETPLMILRQLCHGHGPSIPRGPSLHPEAVHSLFINPWQLLLLLAAPSYPQCWRD